MSTFKPMAEMPTTESLKAAILETNAAPAFAVGTGRTALETARARLLVAVRRGGPASGLHAPLVRPLERTFREVVRRARGQSDDLDVGIGERDVRHHVLGLMVAVDVVRSAAVHRPHTRRIDDESRPFVHAQPGKRIGVRRLRFGVRPTGCLQNGSIDTGSARRPRRL